MGFILVDEVTLTIGATVKQMLSVDSIVRVTACKRLDFPDCNAVVTLSNGDEIYVAQGLSCFISRFKV